MSLEICFFVNSLLQIWTNKPMDSIFSIEKRNKRSHNAVRTDGAWARRSSNFSHGLPAFKFSVCRGIVTFYETMKAFVASSLCEFPIYFRCIVSISNTLLFQHHLWVIVQSLSLSFLPAPPSLAMSLHSESCCFLHLPSLVWPSVSPILIDFQHSPSIF